MGALWCARSSEPLLGRLWAADIYAESIRCADGRRCGQACKDAGVSAAADAVGPFGDIGAFIKSMDTDDDGEWVGCPPQAPSCPHRCAGHLLLSSRKPRCPELSDRPAAASGEGRAILRF